MFEQILLPYGLFVAQTTTFFLLLMLLLFVLVRVLRSSGPKPGQLSVRPLDLLGELISHPGYTKVLGKKERKKRHKILKIQAKQKIQNGFVLDFKGDMQASGAKRLAEEVNVILELARPEDRVLLRLESPGGSVVGYGLAACQLKRLKDQGIILEVAVDKVAASGGYLMAVVADQIWASSFAVLGSIGVVTSLPNFRRFLSDKKVDFEQITAGEDKRTLTLFGENTAQDRAKVQSEVDAIHQQFKDWVARFRPQLDLEKVATGQWWHGEAALALGLIDQLGTSDQRIQELGQTHQLYTVRWNPPKPTRGALAKGLRFLARLRDNPF